MIHDWSRGILELVISAAITIFAMGAVHAAAGPEDDLTLAEDCGNPFINAYGPLDYNNAADRTERMPIVEHFHLTPQVERLERGQSSANVLDDLAYTLQAVPNHPRALNAVARYDLEKGGILAPHRSVECWFDRAMRFRPDDGMVRLLFGNYKARKGRLGQALDAYQAAKELMPDNVEVDYNLGLLYFRMEEYDKALECARVAYAGHYPLQGLKNKLAAKGLAVTP